MATQWKCPDPNCPPTDFPPVDVTAPGDEVRTVVCGGVCGKEYPKGSVKPV